jgi:hypothetical protein
MIEQFTVGLTVGRTVQKGKEYRRVLMHCLTIRTVEPFDWIKLIRSSERTPEASCGQSP